MDAMCLEFFWFAELSLCRLDNLNGLRRNNYHHLSVLGESAEARHIVLKFERDHFSNVVIDKEEMMVVERSIETGGQVHDVNTV